MTKTARYLGVPPAFFVLPFQPLAWSMGNTPDYSGGGPAVGHTDAHVPTLIRTPTGDQAGGECTIRAVIGTRISAIKVAWAVKHPTCLCIMYRRLVSGTDWWPSRPMTPQALPIPVNYWPLSSRQRKVSIRAEAADKVPPSR